MVLHVIAFFGSRGVFCYTPAGELVWQNDLMPPHMNNNIVNAASGIYDVMPTPGLCRAWFGRVLSLRGISDSRNSQSRHNHRLSKNASSGSGGRNRSGTAFEAVACASAFSLSCMSA